MIPGLTLETLWSALSGSAAPSGSTTGSATASYVDWPNVHNEPTLFSSSFQVDYNGIFNKPFIPPETTSLPWTSITSKPTGIVSSSVQLTTWNTPVAFNSQVTFGSNANVGHAILDLGTKSAAFTLNLSDGNIQKFTKASTGNWNMSNIVGGLSGGTYIIEIRSLGNAVVSPPANLLWSGGAQGTTGTGAGNIVVWSIFVSSSGYLANMVGSGYS